MPERFALQGKDPFLAARLKNGALALKASGNAYPTSLITAGLQPLLVKIAESGVAHAGLTVSPHNAKIHSRIYI